MEGIEYPITKQGIVIFEKQNPQYIIYVWYLKDINDKFSLRPIYSKTIIDLLYLEDGETTHYCLIKDLNSYLCSESRQRIFLWKLFI